MSNYDAHLLKSVSYSVLRWGQCGMNDSENEVLVVVLLNLIYFLNNRYIHLKQYLALGVITRDPKRFSFYEND